ncbi:MAG: hypothetical protein HY900_33885 [Deltaproteobacteria bacterium]|nr:hypothetical protein [Deltaproteobacteria bacterium]
MRGGVAGETFFDELMSTTWFPDTVERFFDGEYRRKFDEVLRRLGERSVLGTEGGRLMTSVKP